MALQARLIVSTLGLSEKGADEKELEGKSKTEKRMRATVKERDIGFFFLTGFLNLVAHGESGLIGMHAHLLLSSALLLFCLSLTEDYAYSTRRAF